MFSASRDVQVTAGRAAAWGGTERWLSLEEFSNQLHRPPFHVLLGCESWQVLSVLSTPWSAADPPHMAKQDAAASQQCLLHSASERRSANGKPRRSSVFAVE